MKVAFFDTHSFERESFEHANRNRHEVTFFDIRLTESTAPLAAGYSVICAFVNDRINRAVIEQLADGGTQLIALRSAGFNQVDLAACAEFDLRVVRVPAYSPYAVAEHALALLLALNRRIHRAFNRVRELNFSLEGLVGFDLHGKTVGIVGLGKIGAVFANICHGLGMNILAYDVTPNKPYVELLGGKCVSLNELYRNSDIISLHVPLLPETHHLLDERAFSQMKRGAVIINTSRGALIDSKALVEALKEGQIGAAALDVYEEEEGIFFSDHSGEVLQDDTLARLLTFPNVIITSHQAFLTREALDNIAETTLENISAFEAKRNLENEVPRPERHHSAVHDNREGPRTPV